LGTSRDHVHSVPQVLRSNHCLVPNAELSWTLSDLKEGAMYDRGLGTLTLRIQLQQLLPGA